MEIITAVERSVRGELGQYATALRVNFESYLPKQVETAIEYTRRENHLEGYITQRSVPRSAFCARIYRQQSGAKGQCAS